jgi:hypothetical protein
MRVFLLPGVEHGITHHERRQRSPMEVPASAWRIACRICSSENFYRFMGPFLSYGTVEAVLLLSL